MVLGQQAIAWKRVREVGNKWIHKPDFLALRAMLAAAKALDLPTRPVWVMLIGAGDSGKTTYYIRSCEGYPKIEITDQTTSAGIRAAAQGQNWGKGILSRLGDRGLWLFPDFTVILKMRDEKRDEVFGIQRRIFDGSYNRSAAGDTTTWKGRVHCVATVTPAIERYYHAYADLGQRFLQVRVDRAQPCDDLQHKINAQAANWEQYQDEVKNSAAELLSVESVSPDLPFALARRVLDWADFVSMCRTPTQRNYKDEIVYVGAEEGCSRISQQLQGMIQADALLLGQDRVGPSQLELAERVALDCLPWARRAILSWFRTTESIDYGEVRKMSDISHPYTFDRTVDELEAVGAIVRESTSMAARIRLSDRAAAILAL